MPDSAQGSGGPQRRGKPPRSLFARMLFAFLGALAILLLLVVGSVLLGVGYSTRDWSARKGRNLQELLLPLVRETYRATGKLDRELIAGAVAPFLTGSAYVIVFDASQALVYGYRQGERLDGKSGSQGGRNFLRRHAGQIEPVALIHQGREIGLFAAGILGFADDAENRQFLETLALIGAGGAAGSFLLALTFALLFSSRIAGQASSLATGLARLAGGDRGVLFPRSGTRELAQIGSSAAALQAQLSKEEALRTQWAADVAHDLRTPIAAVKSQVEAMMDGVLPATPQRLGRALGELSRVESLVNDLGELARIESPEMRLSIAEVRAEDFVEELGARFALEAEKRGVAFTRSSSLVSFQADETLLLRAVTNAVQNAIQHTDRGGAVDVRIGEERGADGDAGVVVLVENTGMIPENEVPRVFDRLYRGEHSRHARGSGLGLTIAKAIVDLHGGSIGIGNTPSGSVRVALRLPRR